MKINAVLFCLFLSISTFAQQSDTGNKKADTTKVVFRCMPSYNSNEPLYIVDGKIIKSIDNVKPDSILEISVLKDSAATAIYGRNLNGVIIIINRRFAVTQYQNNFSNFSKEYKRYIHSNNDDSKVLYIINGVTIDGKPDDIIRKLYELKKDNVKSVSINKKGMKEEGMISKPLVTITTK